MDKVKRRMSRKNVVKKEKQKVEKSVPEAVPRINSETVADKQQKTESGNHLERYGSKIMYTPEYEKYIDSLISNYHSSNQIKLPPRKRISIDLEEKIIGTLSARTSLKPVESNPKNVGKLAKQGSIKIKHRQALENLVKKHMPAEEVEVDEEERDSLQDWIMEALKDIDRKKVAVESLGSLRSVEKEKRKRKHVSTRPIQSRYAQFFSKSVEAPVMKVGFGSGFREVKHEEMRTARTKIMMKEKKVLDLVKNKIDQPTPTSSVVTQFEETISFVPLKLPILKEEIEAKLTKPLVTVIPVSTSKIGGAIRKLSGPLPKLGFPSETSTIDVDKVKEKYEIVKKPSEEWIGVKLQPQDVTIESKQPVVTVERKQPVVIVESKQPVVTTKVIELTLSPPTVDTKKPIKAKPDVMSMTQRTMTLAEGKLEVQVKKIAKKMFFDPLKVPLGEGTELDIEKPTEELEERDGQATIIERRRGTKVTEHVRTRGILPSYATSSLGEIQATPAMRERASIGLVQERPTKIELTAPKWSEVEDIAEEKDTGIPKWLIKQTSRKNLTTEKKVGVRELATTVRRSEAAPLPELDATKRRYVRIPADLPEIPATKPATTKYSPSKLTTDLDLMLVVTPRLPIQKKTAPSTTITKKAPGQLSKIEKTAAQLSRSERVSTEVTKSPEETLAAEPSEEVIAVRPTATLPMKVAIPERVSTVGLKSPEEMLATKASVEMVPVRSTELAIPESVSTVDVKYPKATLATEGSTEKISVRPTTIKPPASVVPVFVEEPSVNIFGETPLMQKKKDLKDRKISVIEGISPLSKPKLLRTKRRELIQFEEREAKKEILRRPELKRYEKPYTRWKKGYEQITEYEGKGDGRVSADDKSISVGKKTRFIRTPEIKQDFPKSETSLRKMEFQKQAILLYEMRPSFCIRGIDDPVSILAMPPASQRVMDGTVPTGSSEAFPAEDIINYRPFSRDFSVDSSGDTVEYKALKERLLEEGPIRETNFCDIMEQRGFAPKIKRSDIENHYVWRQSMSDLVGTLPTFNLNTKEKPRISHWLKETKQFQRIGSKVRSLKDHSKVNYRSQSLNREAVNQIKTQDTTEVSTSRGFAMLEEVRTPKDIRTTNKMEIGVKSLKIPKHNEAAAVRRLSKMPSKDKQVSRTRVDRVPLNHKVLSLELFGQEEKRPLSKEELDEEQKCFPFLSIKKWRKY